VSPNRPRRDRLVPYPDSRIGVRRFERKLNPNCDALRSQVLARLSTAPPGSGDRASGEPSYASWSPWCRGPHRCVGSLAAPSSPARGLERALRAQHTPLVNTTHRAVLRRPLQLPLQLSVCPLHLTLITPMFPLAAPSRPR
jgi:hypothetical protein